MVVKFNEDLDLTFDQEDIRAMFVNGYKVHAHRPIKPTIDGKDTQGILHIKSYFEETSPEYTKDDIMSSEDEEIFIREFMNELKRECEPITTDSTFETFNDVCNKLSLKYLEYFDYLGQDFNDKEVQQTMINDNVKCCVMQCLEKLMKYIKVSLCISDKKIKKNVSDKIFPFMKKYNMFNTNTEDVVDQYNLSKFYFDYELLKDEIENIPGLRKLYNKYYEFII